jgi:hypothetical protein
MTVVEDDGRSFTSCALERKGELQSGVERCVGGWGWCSPFMRTEGVSRRQQRSVTAGVIALVPLMAEVVMEGGVKLGV